MISKFALALALVAAIPAVAVAGPVAPGFTNGGSIAPNDDGFTSLIATPFALNFFGTTYGGFYASNNGYLTFNNGQGTYTPGGLGAGYSGQPIIAAYFADVDTRGIGTVTYGSGTYNGVAAYGVTWTNVGYFGSHTDKTDTFQILLTDRSDTGTGNFDIYLNYNQVQWESGDYSGGSAGLGGTSAAVGYNAGQPGDPVGTYFEEPGSRVPGTFIDSGTAPLIRTTNDGVPGQLAFQVRSGAVAPPPPPVSGVPEPTSWAMMIGGFGMIGAAMRRRKVAVTFA